MSVTGAPAGDANRGVIPTGDPARALAPVPGPRSDLGVSDRVVGDAERVAARDAADPRPSGQPAPSPTWRPGAPAWPSRVALLLTVLFGVGLVALHVGTYSPLSPYDEPMHIDYVYRVLDGEVVSAGDPITPRTQADVACRGIDQPGEEPPCGGPYELGHFPGHGYNSAYIHSPIYYAVTAGFTVGFDWLPGDVVDTMRLSGALWLALALVLLWFALREVGVGWPVRAAAGLTLAAVPIVLLTQSTVNNDGTALAAGAALTLAALRWDQGRLSVWWVSALVLGAMLLKSTNLAILLAVGLFILVRAVQRRPVSTPTWRAVLTRRPLLDLAIVGGGAVVGGLVWTLIYPRLAIVDPTVLPANWAFLQDQFQPGWLGEQLTAVTSPLAPQFYDSALQGDIATIIATAANYGILALAVVGALRADKGSQVRALGAATAMAMAMFGPIMVVVNYVLAQVYIALPARYGLSLVPALILIGASAIRSPKAQAGALVAGLGVFSAIAVRLVAG